MSSRNLSQLIAALSRLPWLSFELADIHSRAAYAVYFDHKRRTDPSFRKALKRESRKEARIARVEAEAQGSQQRQAIEVAMRGAREEGFPVDVEDKEAYFMNEVGHGEALCHEGTFSVSTIWRKCHMLRLDSRQFARRGGALLLQGSQGLSQPKRPDPYLRQDCAQAGHRHPSGDDCVGSDHQRWSLWYSRLRLSVWFCHWDRLSSSPLARPTFSHSLASAGISPPILFQRVDHVLI